MADPKVRIATRKSQLALWQANWVADRIRELGQEPELVEITTVGDVQQSGPIAQLGEQGVFTKEVQAAVIRSDADLAVHSLKDLPTEPIDGLQLAAVPQRASVADALICHSARSLAELPAGARLGTGSLRRQAQAKRLRPDIQVLGIRGNVDTRLKKLDEGEYDAILLAEAGLTRLGWNNRITELLGPPRMLPAPGQGALGLECRSDDTKTAELLWQLNHAETHAAVVAERSMLALLHAGCSAPVGGWGRIESGKLKLDGLVANLAGTKVLEASGAAELNSAQALGQSVANELLELGAAQIIAAAKNS